MGFTTSQTGINLIKSFESLQLKAYQDSVGVWTIGYGHTSGVYEGMTITELQAEAYLRSDLTTAENAVNTKVTYSIVQHQFDALVSFTFNVGTSNFGSSTLLKKLNAGDVSVAADQFDVWIYAGGKVLNGLVNRRVAEKELFLNGTFSVRSSGDSTVSAFQTWLNSNYASGLTVDGMYGNNTKKATIKAYQKILGVTADGVFGAASQDAVQVLKSGSRGNDVYIMQGMLYCRGLDPKGVDGTFGAGAESAVKAFQASKSLKTDGLAGKDTMYQLYN